MKKNKIKFLVIGDLPLATQVMRFIKQKKEIEIEAFFTQYTDKKFYNDPWEDVPSLYEEIGSYAKPVFHNQNTLINNFSKQYFDFGISCRANVIYKPSFLNLFKNYLINMHGGILPKRAGLNIACHSIIEGDKYSGGTLHVINEKIDDGDIIAREKFLIKSKDTALTVYQKTQKCLLDLFKKNLTKIISNKIKPIPQEKYLSEGEVRNYHSKNEIFDLKKVSFKSMSEATIDRRVRGCDFPGHEPAYTIVNNKKVYLTTQNFFK